MTGSERIAGAFRALSGELPGLIPYLTAGFPTRDATTDLLLAAERGGAMLIEVGIPFSDPLADGPTIQASSQAALEAGMTPQLALDQIAAARDAGLRVPVAVMTYTNIVLSADPERFCAEAATAGADALIVPDLPLGEDGAIRDAALGAGLSLVPLLAPTTTEQRLAEACARATGFVYCVGVVGVTGARTALAAEGLALLERVGTHSRLPRAFGFGLSRHEHLMALRGRAEAAVIGSALIDAIATTADPAGAVTRFLGELAGATAATSS